MRSFCFTQTNNDFLEEVDGDEGVMDRLQDDEEHDFFDDWCDERNGGSIEFL
jgi:hypothetical protein